MLDLQAVRAVAEQAALRGGEVVMPLFNQPHNESTKANIYDVVTEGDKAVEAAIIPFLREAYPQFGIVSEEGGGADFETGDYAWHIDPIDGTTNFANNIPFFSISIALADRALNPVVGVVYNPVNREMFSAAHGQGATLNGMPIHASRLSDMNRAVMATGFSTRRHTLPEEVNNLREFREMLWRVRDLRRFGSAALELAFVACGRLDGFWERHMNSWDVLGGVMLILEAGGAVSDYSGGMDQLLRGREVVASNGLLHAEILAVLNG